MIPEANITQWRENAPWITDEQVEQDLVLSRVLVELFSDAYLSSQLAFRGGTALHKLFFNSPARYSEDIDLVRTTTGPIKEIIDAIRDNLDIWLGAPKTMQNKGRFPVTSPVKFPDYEFESSVAVKQIYEKLICKMQGEPWKTVDKIFAIIQEQ